MKILIFIILFTVIVSGCNKSDDDPDYKIIDDIYGGYFSYKGINYWSSINFDHYNYIEWPSGGGYY